MGHLARGCGADRAAATVAVAREDIANLQKQPPRMGRHVLHCQQLLQKQIWSQVAYHPAGGQAVTGQGKLQGQHLEMYPFPFAESRTKAVLLGSRLRVFSWL